MKVGADGGLDGALDRLADMGLGALMREVIEPICAAMMAKARVELSTESGAKRAFSEYWSFARAIAHAFDEPRIASQSAAMFFAEAPKHCQAWCAIEQVDGRERMPMSAMKALAGAASLHVDGNTGAFGEQLIQAIMARGTESSQAALNAAMSSSAPKAPKAMAALRKDLSSGFVWPKDEVLDASLEAFIASRRSGTDSEPLDASLESLLMGFENESEGRGNHALSIVFCAKLACAAAAELGCLGMRRGHWLRIVDAMVDSHDLAKEESSETRKERKRNLSKIDMAMLSSWRTMMGSARERVAAEIALAAVERAGEPGGAQASAGLVGFLKETFWGAGAKLGKPNQASFTEMAQALCNRLCRDGGLACLPLESAKELHSSMASWTLGPPSQWCALSDPETLDWMLRQAGEPQPHGSRWRELAALARLGEIAEQREASWVQAISGWGLQEGEESMNEAISAKDLAKGLGASPLGRAICHALEKSAVPDGDGLGRLQDALRWLSDLGASDGACSRAEDAMSEALAVLERSALDGALRDPAGDPSGDPSAAPARRARL